MKCCAVFSFCLALFPVAFCTADSKPNFIVIMTDDQGYQDVGCFGSPNIKTPHLDQMAVDGMKFTDFYSMAPICSASRAGLLTGCYPPRVGIVGAYFPHDTTGLHPDEITIAEILKTRGYVTACIGKWHLGHLRKFLPTNQGFDSFFGLPYSNDMDPVKTVKRDLDRAYIKNDMSRWNVPLMRHEAIIERPVHQPTLTRRYTEEAIKFIDDNNEKSFFLYLPHTMPHIPIFVSEDFRTDDPAQAYKRCIEEIDWSVGRVLEAVKRNGIDENTLIVFTSDNGPWLKLKPPYFGGSARPLRAGKFTTYEGGMRVPAIARWSGRIPAGSNCDQVAGTFDLLPTFAGLAGASLPANKIDGLDIWPLMSGRSKVSPHEGFYYFQVGGRLQSMRKGKWKIRLPETAGQGVTENTTPAELYDLSTDVGEQHNVGSEHQSLVANLVKQAQAFEDSLKSEARPEGRL